MSKLRRNFGPARALLLAAVLASPLGASNASKLYQLGQKAERAGQIAQAYLYYSRAAALEPKKKVYSDRAAALEPMAAIAAHAAPPEAGDADLDARAVDADARIPDDVLTPAKVFDSVTAEQMRHERELQPPMMLTLPAGIDSYRFDGDYKSLFGQAAKKLGLDVVFDSDFEAGRPLRIRLDEVSPATLLRGLEAATHSFITPLSPKLFVVATDTDAKRKDLEQTAAITVPLPHTTTAQEITEIGQALRQTVGVEHMLWDTSANTIVFRDRAARAFAAQAVLNDLIGYKTQIAMDLEFIEVDRTQMQQLGADIQLSFPINYIGPILSQTLNNTAASVATAAMSGASLTTLAQLAKFSVTRMFGVGVANMDIIAQMSDAGAKTLLTTTMTALEGQKSVFHVGDKYPIITSQFVGAVNTGGQVFTPTPSFTFEDLGIVVNVTPHAHAGGEVTLDLDSEFKVLGTGSLNGIPVISSRKLTTMVRLRQNQWAVVAGLTQDTESTAVSGPAFFSYVPFLGHLISHWTHNRARTYVLLAIRPRLLSVPPAERVTHPIWVGSETRTATPL